jgi:hypothetical protein
LYPESFKTLIEKLDRYIEKITKDDWGFEDKKLVGLKKLTEVNERNDENLGILERTLAEDDVIQDEIIPSVDEMLEELGDLEDLD